MYSISRDQTSQECLACCNKRTEYWMDLEKYFDALPPYLSACVRNFRANIAGLCGDSGLVKDFLCGNPKYPVLDLPVWIFHDLRLSLPAQAEEACRSYPADNLVQKRIFQGGVFLVAASMISNPQAARRGCIETSDHLLSFSFLSAGQRSFAGIFSPSSPFWERYRKIINEYLEFRLLGQEIDHAGCLAEADWPLIGKQWAMAKIAPIASAIATDNMSLVDPLEQILDELANLFQIQLDLLNLKRDLMAGYMTYPIKRIMRTAGIDLIQPLEPEKVLGALLLLNPMPALLRFCLERLSWCRSLCDHWSLGSIDSLLKSWEVSFDQLIDLFTLRSQVTTQGQRIPETRSLFFPLVHTPSALAMKAARSYLLSDPTFYESWEVHRWGFLGEPLLTGKVFPSGIILYLLSSSGLDLRREIDTLFDLWNRQGCRYYEEPCALPPDTDSAGLMMRLIKFSGSKEKNYRILDPSLRRIVTEASPLGAIPTYLNPPEDPNEEQGSCPRLFGNSCGTIRAMVLLGLKECGDEQHRDLVNRSARQLCESIACFGSSVNCYYTHLYWIWMTFQLLATLRQGYDDFNRSPEAEKVGRLLIEQTEKEIQKREKSTQETALLILIGHCEGCTALFDPSWVERVVDRQQYDGSWKAEPFYRVPTLNPNCPGWYSSRLVTTAMCYHALATYYGKQGGTL